jgi:hypothetical protein
MNLVHRWLCSSAKWRNVVETYILPWTLEDVNLGSDLLEIADSAGSGLHSEANLTLVADADSLHIVGICLSRQVGAAIERERSAVASLLGQRLGLIREGRCTANRICDDVGAGAEIFV